MSFGPIWRNICPECRYLGTIELCGFMVDCYHHGVGEYGSIAIFWSSNGQAGTELDALARDKLLHKGLKATGLRMAYKLYLEKENG